MREITNIQDKEQLKREIAAVDANVKSMEDFTTPEELYEELLRLIRSYYPEGTIEIVEKAYEIARIAHDGQLRKSGEPYIIHPLCVAIILADLEMDCESLVAALLHDVVEDTIMTNEELTEQFGPDVAMIVDGVTKLSQLSYKADKLEEQAENLRKLFLAMAKDIRVILVKLADRLHNMRTLQYMKPVKQHDKSRETLDIYSPIAGRLGLAKIKNELEDLALKYLYPEEYQNLVEQIDQKKEVREEFVRKIVADVRRQIETAGIQAEITGRVKHMFSIYKKMVNQNKTLDQIYDVFAVRIIVPTVRDCYAALGVIHELYTPIPGRFKDYIAMPKPNMYQSLHTTLISATGRPFEIQIRTFAMHRVAEYGIAAHWRYKSGEDMPRRPGDIDEEEKLNWLRQILEWQQDSSDNKEFMSLLKSDLDLFTENVYVFSPAGDLKALPSGSCTIDFAYAVHSAVGNRMVGARINGKLVPIETVLQNGDRIEIITSQNSRGPSRDWLKVVKSTTARNRINRWFREEKKEDNILKGRDALNAYAKRKEQPLSEYLKPAYMERVMHRYGFNDWESVLAAIGHGGLKEGQVLNRLKSAWEADQAARITDQQVLEAVQGSDSISHLTENERHKGGITVRGITDVSVRFSKCCSPIPGDEIVGFVTRGRGITIHRTDCVNIMTLPESERDRLIDAEWAPEQDGRQSYTVEIKVFAQNRTGLLVDISRVFSDRGVDMSAINVRLNKQNVATMEITFDVSSRDELMQIMQKIRQVENVTDVSRTVG
ncbi:MAG: bifunctional (p)ppGpp synthetase/guanosine-3',5'-bis(diphosphate) 3'-pyrophosphohydrolase [Eubacterium sp.]|nr:bifunctional (p)ppGpp synthetase/guanosine-3',5'-bis(diphosphate) 3'-pyrophosphohydrolase [Eubacterium sp.]